MPPIIGTPTASTRAGNIILSIRDQIPDPVNDPIVDGTAFSLASLLRWLNDGMRIMASSAPIVQDWYAIGSENGMDVYEIPDVFLSVEQLWYDLWPCFRSPEWSALFVNKISSRSYFFGPHSLHAQPRIHVWPAADRTAATTTLSTTISATDTSIVAASIASFNQYGFFEIEGELILYRTVTAGTNTFSTILRGQGGTTAAPHTSGATISEKNIFFKASRLPTALTGVGDVLEIPVGLTPVLELYVLSKVREAEQESELAKSLRQEFAQAVQMLSTKAQNTGQIRQGIQVRTTLAGPLLYGGRVYVP
jgi:hypothetical protein